MSSHQQPLTLATASVICYSHARFVVEALESIKAQAYPNLQLVVVDDSSRDDSAEILRQWLDRHFPDAVFVGRKTNTGLLCAKRSLRRQLRRLAGSAREPPARTGPRISALPSVGFVMRNRILSKVDLRPLARRVPAPP